MNRKELEDYLESELDYPTDNVTVMERAGDVTVDAPDDADSVTIAALLTHSEGEVYESPDALFESIMSSLPDEYIGRKFYDDRGSNPIETGEGPEDEENQSF